VQQSGNNLVLAYTRFNTSPVFAGEPIGLNATPGVEISGAITATDADLGEVLSYAKISGPAWLTFATDGTFRGTPLSTDVGTNSFTVTATDTAGASAQAVLTILVTPPDPDANDNGINDAWETTKFGNANLGANLATDDPDGDGLANLIEYALDTHPLVPNKTPLIYDFHELPSGKHLRLTVPKNPQATNLTFIVEVGSDLGDWSEVPTTIESQTDTELIVRDNINMADSSRRFIRLKVRGE
jgi:hypothetical protein